MKKFRIMLPVLAVVFAIAGAVAGDFFSPINAFYKISNNCSENTLPTEQGNCQTGLPTTRPVCTVVSGSSHLPAYADGDCTVALRYIP